MTAREFLKDKHPINSEHQLERLLEQFAREYFTKTDLRSLLLSHPNRDEVQNACLHFLGDDAQKWWESRQIELNKNY